MIEKLALVRQAVSGAIALASMGVLRGLGRDAAPGSSSSGRGESSCSLECLACMGRQSINLGRKGCSRYFFCKGAIPGNQSKGIFDFLS